MRNRTLLVILTVCMLMLAALPAAAAPRKSSAGSTADVSCTLPESNAESLEILSNYYPGYWWDHTDLTIAVQSAPNVPTRHLRAINEAIETWTEVLEDCFDGAITLTNVTGTQPSEQKAEIGRASCRER